MYVYLETAPLFSKVVQLLAVLHFPFLPAVWVPVAPHPCKHLIRSVLLILTILGEGNGNPLQYCCLENPMDRGAWYATVYGVTKSWTRLSDFTSLHFFQSLQMYTFSSHLNKTEQQKQPLLHSMSPFQKCSKIRLSLFSLLRSSLFCLDLFKLRFHLNSSIKIALSSSRLPMTSRL